MNQQERAERARKLREDRGVAAPTLRNIQTPLEDRTTGTDAMFPAAAAKRTGDVQPIIDRGVNDPNVQSRMQQSGMTGLFGMLGNLFSPDEGKEYSEAESLAAGALDTVTMGNAPEFMEASRGSPGAANLVLGAANSLANMLTGEAPMPPSEAASARHDEQIAENRGSSLVGQVVGAFGPGGLLAKGMQSGVKYLPKGAEFLTDTFIGRAISSSVAGGVEGGAYARSKDENIVGGAAAGTIGGAVGSSTLDLLGKGINGLFGTASKTHGRQLVGEQMEYGGQAIRRDEILEDAQILGPRATLSDVDQGAMLRGERNLVSANRNEESQGLAGLMEERLGNPRVPSTGQGQVYEEFSETMRDLLPEGFTPISGDLDAAVAKDTMRQISRNYFNAISDEFGTALRDSELSVDPKRFSQSLERAARGPGIVKPRAGGKGTVNKGSRDAWAKVQREIREQTSTKKVSKKGGARGEKETVNLPHNAQQLHNIRMFIDDTIDSSYGPEGTSLGRNELAALSRMRTAVTDRLNSDPAIADVNRKYATQASYMRAYDLGTQILTRNQKAMSSEGIEDWMVAANQGDINGFIHGVSRVLLDQINKARGEASTTRLLAMDDEIADRLRAVFPDIADDIINRANSAMRLADTAGTMIRGSQTGRRSMMQQQEGTGGNITDIGVVSGWFYNLLGGSGGVSHGAGAGALRRLMPGMTDPAETLEMDRLLTAQGPEQLTSVLDEIEQALGIGRNPSRLSFPRTMSGPDAALDAQAGRIPATALTEDIGQTLPFSLGTSAAGAALNTPHRIDQREQERRRQQYIRERQNPR